MTPLEQLADYVRQVGAMIAQCEDLQQRIGDPAASAAIADHLATLRAEQRRLVGKVTKYLALVD